MQILAPAGGSVSLLLSEIFKSMFCHGNTKERTLILNCDTITGFTMATNPGWGFSPLLSGVRSALLIHPSLLILSLVRHYWWRRQPLLHCKSNGSTVPVLLVG